MMAITFVVILLSLTVTIISVSMWMFVQDFREIRRKVLMLEAKAEQTEPSTERHLPDYSYESGMAQRLKDSTDCPWK